MLAILHLENAVELYTAVVDARTAARGRADVDHVPLVQSELDKILEQAQ